MGICNSTRAGFGFHARLALLVLLTAPGASQAEILFGPETFDRENGKPVIESRSFDLSGYEAPFTLHLRNGDEDGEHRASSARIWLNDQMLLDTSRFSQKASEFEFDVDLAETSTLEVWIASKPGSRITIWIEGTPNCAEAFIAAIEDANATPEPDVISLDCDVVLQSVHNDTNGPNGLPVITSPIVIEGNGHSISRASGAPRFRIFAVLGSFAGSGDLTLEDVTIANADIDTGTDCFFSLEQCGGGILNHFGQLTLRNTRFLGNSAFAGGALFNTGTARIVDSQFGMTGEGNSASSGGAIYNAFNLASMTLLNSSFQGNLAEFDGGAIHNQAELFIYDAMFDSNSVYGTPAFGGGGGALYNNSFLGQVEIANSAFHGNSAIRGGALSNFNASRILIRNSDISNNSTTDMAVARGGGIWSDNNTYLEIHNSRVNDNQAIGGFASGGGIFSGGGLNSSLILVNSTVGNNSAARDGGGIYMDSGNPAVVSDISSSAIVNNTASGGDGGGIYKNGISPLTITGSLIAGNSVSSPNGHGGGLFFDNPTSNPHAHNIVATTISSNQSGFGGGIYSEAFTGTISISNSTIANNRVITNGALGEGGAGIANQHGNLTITNSTISGNRVETSSGDPSGSGAAIHHGNGGVVSIDFSTLANNSSRDGGGIRAQSTVVVGNSVLMNTAVNGPNCNPFLVITDNDNNFVDDATNCPPGFTETASLNLGPLADNGGTTMTHALLAGSDAIDSDGPCGLTDQRGVSRDAACDSGAFEAAGAVLPLISFDVDSSSASEGSAVSVNVTLDNSGGNLASGALTVSLVVGGTAAEGSDFATSSALPLTFSGASWPSPGTTVTQTVDLDLFADNLEEADETIVLRLDDLSLIGPAAPGAQVQHTLTVSDTP